MKMSENKKGVIALVTLSAILASYGLFPRFLSSNFELFQQVYLRMFVAFLLSLIFFEGHFRLFRFFHQSRKDTAVVLLRSFLYYIPGVVLGSQALIIAKYSNVSFIYILPFTALFGIILLKEKLTFLKALFLSIALVGVGLVSVKDASIFGIGLGEVLAIISAMALSLSYVTRKWEGEYLNNYEMTTLMLFLGSVMVFIGSLIAGEGLPISGWDLGISLAVVAAGAINVLGMLLTNYAFDKVGAILANNLLTLSFVFAIIFGFLFFRELPTVREILGGLLIVISVLGINRYANEK